MCVADTIDNRDYLAGGPARPAGRSRAAPGSTSS